MNDEGLKMLDDLENDGYERPGKVVHEPPKTPGKSWDGSPNKSQRGSLSPTGRELPWNVEIKNFWGASTIKTRPNFTLEE